ncbi:hypothetical protein HUE56_13880 [Azospirillum oryzae]|uniref:Lipoprotein n=1 Tax=Azospirillum oryzae TaxID=286727 RepID=A0A6N1AKA1_9PROT|nr:hypothetical protein [Azospirillum oryzae]KAA0589721.1 hypothetical protein FZ938_08890 [Azospirillum oryzae]QKS51558.1 hypothetical protein HUE56_13880 [Azospirillum oryzae]GLR78413.1 hypothetical protein GCM10007856_10850 [Azospirillum oryzae]
MVGAGRDAARTGSRRARLVLSLAISAWALTGCTSPLGLAAAGADVVTLNATKKTIGDHIVSAATGRDCSILSFEKDGDYCPDKVEVDRSRLYCYRTLADVECHHIPDPYRNGNTALASPPPDIRTLPRKRSWFDDATPYTANNGS